MKVYVLMDRGLLAGLFYEPETAMHAFTTQMLQRGITTIKWCSAGNVQWFVAAESKVGTVTVTPMEVR